jgi:hypothetical protein
MKAQVFLASGTFSSERKAPKMLKRLLLGSGTALAIATSASASTIPDFRTFPNYTLECESAAPDRTHLFLEVLPSEMTVKHNSKGESLSFTVVHAFVNTSSRNRFGHDALVPYVFWVEFKDKHGNIRAIIADPDTDSSHYIRLGAADSGTKGWRLRCLPGVSP